MITFERALGIMGSTPRFEETETGSFQQSMGRVLAENILSDMDMPPFDKSAMDGYACRREDIGSPMTMIEEIPAGKIPKHKTEPGTCSRIMTGAPLPEGADTVIMEEVTQTDRDGRICFIGEHTQTNICRRGEDIKTGDLLIEKGTLLRAAHIAILASAGAVLVKVARQPSFAIFSTGDELVEPHIKPAGSMIRNSNGYQIQAQLYASGYRNISLPGIVRDTPSAVESAINEGFKTHDILIFTGGVSMGEYDYIPRVVEKCGIKILFHKLAVQPGKPVLFGRRSDNKYIFGLPGNPVSSFIQTELLVKYFAGHLQGQQQFPGTLRLSMGKTYSRRRSERKAFVPARVVGGEVFPIEYHGSAHIQALHKTDGFIIIGQGQLTIEEGALADVRLI